MHRKFITIIGLAALLAPGLPARGQGMDAAPAAASDTTSAAAVPAPPQADELFLTVEELFEQGIRHSLTLQADAMEEQAARERERTARTARPAPHAIPTSRWGSGAVLSASPSSSATD